MTPDRRHWWLQWCAVLTFGAGSLTLQWAASVAMRLHEPAYWPGIAVGIPLFLFGSALIAWMPNRPDKQQDHQEPKASA